MKQILRILFYILFIPGLATAQITTPAIKAGFGVDGDLRANFFNNFVMSGNDDWFNMGTPGSGQTVIDTTGAAGIVANYLTDVAPYPYRMATIYRGMSVPKYSIINNRLWYDAMWVRDHHGKDSTVFALGSNKNGDSPALWDGDIQNVPDKNDILDVFMTMRRAGPTISDSLWMFCGLSLDNVTGNRYFDFELYQTDIYYDRVTQKWYGYGPDMGHTSWKFDAAGNVIQAGDVIFTASFQSSTLTAVEARIWVKKTDWTTVVPTQFNWGGLFDGASSGSAYGYASISPNSVGAFYTGLSCNNNTWAGPFQVVLQSNAMATTYVKDQLMEFSVNLSKLGIDPVNLFGGDICGSPFNRLVVKTRSSESFTSELKDFVAPLDLFLAPRADVTANIPDQCNAPTVSDIWVTNPYPTSIYNWATPNGHIVGPTTGPNIQADSIGTYIVTQRLQSGCAPYATDTVVITLDTNCSILPNSLLDFRGNLYNKSANLNWKVSQGDYIDYFDVQRSTDNSNFEDIDRVHSETSKQNYFLADDVKNIHTQNIYYRLKLKGVNGAIVYSNVIRLALPKNGKTGLFITPNPVKDVANVTIQATESGTVNLRIYDLNGRLVKEQREFIQPGTNVFTLNDIDKWQAGVYNANVTINGEQFNEKIMVIK